MEEVYGIEHTVASQAGCGEADDWTDSLRTRIRRTHEVTIWFVRDGDKLHISTANVKRRWVQNVQKTAQNKLSIGGEKFEGTARFLAEERKLMGIAVVSRWR